MDDQHPAQARLMLGTCSATWMLHNADWFPEAPRGLLILTSGSAFVLLSHVKLQTTERAVVGDLFSGDHVGEEYIAIE